MRTPSLFPELIPDRLDRAILRVNKRLWKKCEDYTLQISQSTPTSHLTPYAQASELEFNAIESTPHYWGKMFEHCWFKLTLNQTTHENLWLKWRDQGEATLYHNATPYWGLDACHMECLLPEGAREFMVEAICCRTGIWGGVGTTGIHPRGSQFEMPELLQRDDTAWGLWNDLVAARNLLDYHFEQHNPTKERPARNASFHPAFQHATPIFRKWLRRIDEAINHVDAMDFTEAHAIMQALFSAYPNPWSGIRAHLTGHAHIDLVWLWPEHIGVFKATHTFSTMNRLLEQYPEFRFGYSQPASYEAVTKRSPELMAQVHEKMNTGNWEATGATYVESDTQMACGEALARSFILGQEGFQRLTGKHSSVLWLPDVFGYSPCLPQIMAQCGTDYFFTTKLTWSLINRFPYSSFRWRGLDGSEVLVHLSTGNGYNCAVTPQEICGGALQYQQADVHDAYLMPVGYGDGGGGATAEHIERARRYEAVPMLPAVQWGRIDTFFEGLEQSRDVLPAYQGELYLEYHRGVLTTQSDLKKAFRKLESALQTWEAAAAFVGNGEVDKHSWKRLVFAQFHDYIPGSSIAEVYREHVPELRDLANNAIEHVQDALSDKESGADAWFNPLPYAVDYHDGENLYHLPAWSLTPLKDCVALETQAPQASASSLQNTNVHATFSPSGEVLSLIINGKTVPSTSALAQLYLYEDKAANFDAWDIDYHVLATAKHVNTPAEVSIEQGTSHASVVFTRALTERSSIIVRYTLHADDSVLRIHYTIDWHEPERLLKVHFPSNYQGRFARYGCPYGSTRRSQLPGNREDEARWEVPGSRYAIVADDSEHEGLFIVTEAKYGFSCYEGNLQLSLLRSPEYPEQANQPQLRHQDNPLFTDLGEHHIELAIGHFEHDAPCEVQPYTLADTLFTTPVKIEHAREICSPLEKIEAGNSLHACWIKPEDKNTFTLRLNEVMGKRGSCTLQFSRKIKSLERVDFMGNILEQLPTDAPFDYAPYALISLRITLIAICFLEGGSIGG